MGESSNSSNSGMPLANKIPVGPISDLPSDYYDRLFNGRMEGRNLASGVEESIESSKCHWSQVREFDCDDEVVEVSNVEFFETLRRHPTWGSFFVKFGDVEGTMGTLVLGQQFAEGGQAELYGVQIEWWDEFMREQDLRHEEQWVLKVFKKGTSLRQLLAQLPHGLLQFHAEYQSRRDLGLPQEYIFLTDVLCGTLLEDGRFAFLVAKELGDLRSLIDHQQSAPNMGPLPRAETMMAMFEVAYGMNQLHDRGIVHRDLKASNVLISKNGCCCVADYECSVGVMGTGFFRAPEILQVCKDRTGNSKVEVFTKAADVYSYGMTCYEILTGKLPFEGHPLNDYDLVINGARPEVPQHVDRWIVNLLKRCWLFNPASRPSSKEILMTLVANSSTCLLHSLKMRKQVIELRIGHELVGSWISLDKWRLLGLKLRIQLLDRLLKIRLCCFNRL